MQRALRFQMVPFVDSHAAAPLTIAAGQRSRPTLIRAPVQRRAPTASRRRHNCAHRRLQLRLRGRDRRQARLHSRQLGRQLWRGGRAGAGGTRRGRLRAGQRLLGTTRSRRAAEAPCRGRAARRGLRARL